MKSEIEPRGPFPWHQADAMFRPGIEISLWNFKMPVPA